MLMLKRPGARRQMSVMMPSEYDEHIWTADNECAADLTLSWSVDIPLRLTWRILSVTCA